MQPMGLAFPARPADAAQLVAGVTGLVHAYDDAARRENRAAKAAIVDSGTNLPSPVDDELVQNDLD
jgi:hypothetical protein